MATIYYTATTLDGYLATPDHSLDWLFAVPEAPGVQEEMDVFYASVRPMVMGSSTYEWVYRHEGLGENPEKWGQWYGDRPTWVLTHRELPTVAGADLRFTQSPIDVVHSQMLAEANGKDLWVMGGGDVAGQFYDAGLLDRIVATVVPVTLGGGAPLMPRDIRSDRLTLTDVARRGQFVQLTYDIAHEAI